MTIEQIVIFLSIADTKSFTTTAMDFYTTQSSVSKKIQALEDELGVKLFERTARKVRLTKAGEEFVSYAKIMDDAYQQMVMRMEQFHPQKKSILRVSCQPILHACGLLKPLLDFFNANQITLNITECTTVQGVLNDLAEHNADFVIMHDPYLEDTSYEFIPLLSERMAVVFSKQSPLRKQKELRLMDLKNEVFLVNHSDYLQEQKLLNRCIRSHFMPHTLPMDIRLSTMMRHISEGNCIAVMDLRTIAANKTDGVAYKPLMDIPAFHIGFAYDHSYLSHHDEVIASMRSFQSSLHVEAAVSA